MSNYLLRRAESMYHSKVIQNKLEDLSQQASGEANAGPNFSSLEPALWEVVSEIMAKVGSISWQVITFIWYYFNYEVYLLKDQGWSEQPVNDIAQLPFLYSLAIQSSCASIVHG